MALMVQVVGANRAAELDRFDRAARGGVLAVRQQAPLSDAGRAIFAQSPAQKKIGDDADRLWKYLAHFGLDWAEVAELKPAA